MFSTNPSRLLRPSATMVTMLLLALLCVVPTLVSASSGDRNPTFQHCLKGCQLTYCEPHQPPLPAYLTAFGWTCKENCAYECGHSFEDHIRPGSKHHQFYGKWAFYRLGPFQEPFSILMSLGNLYVNLKGLGEVRRRLRPDNGLRGWLVGLGLVQINTWIWSAVFHARDKPTTERLDYFSATLTISYTLLYSIIRLFNLQLPISTASSPSSRSRLLLPVSALMGFIVLGHFTYLLSFPIGSFPYGYHTQFNLVLALVHNILWTLFSLSFKYRWITSPPTRGIQIGSKQFQIGFPRPYPPNDPVSTPRPHDAMTPVTLVLLTCGAMAFELLDFSPVFRIIDAHSLWHAATIPLTIAWWHFLIQDAIVLEGSLLAGTGTGAGSNANTNLGLGDVKDGQQGSASPNTSLRTPVFTQFASMPKGFFPSPNSHGNSRGPSPSPSPGRKVDKPE